MEKVQLVYEVSYRIAGHKYVASGVFDKKTDAIAAAKELFRDFVDSYVLVSVEISRRVKR